MWEFPGGKVEPGESEIAALIRECEEELGVRIEDEEAESLATLGDAVRLLESKGATVQNT